jgi:hypothetical protein
MCVLVLFNVPPLSAFPCGPYKNADHPENIFLCQIEMYISVLKI